MIVVFRSNGSRVCDQTITEQWAAALRQILHGDCQTAQAFRHFEPQVRISQSPAACLNCEGVDWQRTVASGVETFSFFVVDRDQTR